MAKEIKVRGLSPSTVEKLDSIAKKKGFNSRESYLKNHLEMLSISDELKDKDEKYSVLIERVLKVLDYNTAVLKTFMEENLINLDGAIEKEREEL